MKQYKVWIEELGYTERPDVIDAESPKEAAEKVVNQTIFDFDAKSDTYNVWVCEVEKSNYEKHVVRSNVPTIKG